jgi:ribonuclease HI
VVFREGVLYIYADGSSLGSPRRGGFGVRVIYVDDDGIEQVENLQFAGYKGATIGKMEILACAAGLEKAIERGLAAGRTRIIVRTDSMYVVDNIPKAKYEWPNNRWHRRGGAPVLNAEEWKRLIKAMKNARARVDIEWVEGHSKDEHNRAADRLARQAARLPYNHPLSVTHVRRKLSDESVDLGSVGLLGQRLSVRIITTEYLRTQKVWKCKYEVLTKTSPFYMKVDVLFSDELLAAGHCYFIQLNKEQSNPRAAKVFREIDRK